MVSQVYYILSLKTVAQFRISLGRAEITQVNLFLNTKEIYFILNSIFYADTPNAVIFKEFLLDLAVALSVTANYVQEKPLCPLYILYQF